VKLVQMITQARACRCILQEVLQAAQVNHTIQRVHPCMKSLQLSMRDIQRQFT
jgi:hypothetical protein